MSKSIRIRTTPGGEDNYLKFNLKQDFDFLEILSLKLTQEDVYRRFYSDYGVVVGRVMMNNGVGIPNARVSIFIPVGENENEELKSLYPYQSVVDKNDEGIRYNLLPKNKKKGCHVPVGTFPSKRDLLDNDENLEIFEKYYKYTAVTNNAGDFMIFGVPVGNHMINVDVDISDIGIFSQKPYDLIEQGTSEKLFSSTTQFSTSKNINSLPQVKNQQMGINVMPFWGDKKKNEIGITRVDFDLNYNLVPKAIFIGSAFGDNEKNSVNKNCKARKKTGRICETIPNGGRLSMIRRRMDGAIEPHYVSGGELVDESGAWAYQVPMNLDYMITDEFGKLIPTEDPNRGIPTRTSVRFMLESEIRGSEGRLRTKADYLIPHNPKNKDEIDYEFGEQTKESSFRDLYWNKIYTVKNFIPRFQTNRRAESRRFVGFKDVDECVGTKNPIPFNRLDTDFNPLYSIICILLSVIISAMSIINAIISFKFTGIVKFLGQPFCGECLKMDCNGDVYKPNCRCKLKSGEINDEDKLLKCQQVSLAQSLEVYELDFYNDWINGTLYTVLVKYKKKKDGNKFCDVDSNEGTHLADTLINNKFEGFDEVGIKEGLIKDYNGQLFYAPTTKDGRYKLLATDIVSLGVINDYDWQAEPNLQQFLPVSSYKIPPFLDVTGEVSSMVNDGDGKDGLLFNLNCVKISVSETQVKNIKRLCELGVGLDESGSNRPRIDEEDVENQFSRDVFILLNDPSIDTLPQNGLSSNFEGEDYINFRDFNSNVISQGENSFYFYFGTEPNKSAIDKMNKKYFVNCKK